MISNDVKNTTLPNLKGGAKQDQKANPVEGDYRRQMIKQVIVDRIRKGA